MAAGKINLQKASGGITVITGVDGTGNTELVLPESGELATLDSPALTGTPTAPTPTAGDNSIKVATTAYVDGKMVLGTAVNTTSGTAFDFTGIPSWVKRITILFNNVSTNGLSVFALRVGTSSGIATTGYAGAYGYTGASIACFNETTCFGLYNDSAMDLRQGVIHLYLVNASTNTWACEGTMCWSTRSWTLPTSGTVTLLGTLDRLRITTVNGTDTFDAGSINIMYEG